MNIIDRIRAPFAWREVRNTGVWSYVENSVTGERRVCRVTSHGYQPVDEAWLMGACAEPLKATHRPPPMVRP